MPMWELLAFIKASSFTGSSTGSSFSSSLEDDSSFFADFSDFSYTSKGHLTT